ncbi:MAG: TIGR01458 family HAD-type hydrolase [Candidatus Marinarcus sp.]|uniref:TIGR01458 family HAD-type hydrolase n=1 Tax=Candidatus Marinarcus sp. TaxID=3100987 RepID=UPI003B00A42B
MFSKNIKAVLCDIGGVLYVGDAPIDGAIEAVAQIKKHYPIRFITNTTQKTGAQVVKKLQEFGFNICEDEVITALDMTQMFLQKNQSSAQFLLTDNAMHFFDSLKEYPSNYVVVGDAQDNFSYKNLNHAFRKLQQGSQLIAIANNRYFKDSDNELSLDAGCFVSALEYASGQKAQLIGKPSLEFYQLAAASLKAQPNECVMIGDDIESDIEGAQKAGIFSILVKTGKFTETDLEKGITPNQTFESIHDLIL